VPIVPLPQFELDLEEDRKAYQALKAPKSLVVRYGSMKLVGEFPYDGDAKPGCGSKLVVRTPRGTELGEMLTSTCSNSGCSKSVSRKDMLQYIENSGGRDYPFTTDGKVLRVATPDDMNTQAKLEQSKHELKLQARTVVDRLGLAYEPVTDRAPQRPPMPGELHTPIRGIKIVEVEPILGGERLIVHYVSEQRPDLSDLARELSNLWNVRVDFHAVGARDEARLTADYEKCGQYCCCKNFLKVLKPVSMKSAKVQKATLDPLKISGRCGRLMCCLRYEDETYEQLKAKLPKRKVRVGTPDGDGLVLDTQILTQLVLVELEATGKQIAVPVEELTEPSGPPVPRAVPPLGPPTRSNPPGQRNPRPEPRPELRPERPPESRPDAQPEARTDPSQEPRQDPRPTRPLPPRRDATPPPRPAPPPTDLDDIETDLGDASAGAGELPPSRRRRRRRRGSGPNPGSSPGPNPGPNPGPDTPPPNS
jgi:hypothetical protein